MVVDAEAVCRQLELPYRIAMLNTSELGFAAAKSYDIEVWAPGCGEWLEVSSCSNCTDFQARRANIRYRPTPDSKPLLLGIFVWTFSLTLGLILAIVCWVGSGILAKYWGVKKEKD